MRFNLRTASVDSRDHSPGPFPGAQPKILPGPHPCEAPFEEFQGRSARQGEKRRSPSHKERSSTTRHRDDDRIQKPGRDDHRKRGRDESDDRKEDHKDDRKDKNLKDDTKNKEDNRKKHHKDDRKDKEDDKEDDRKKHHKDNKKDDRKDKKDDRKDKKDHKDHGRKDKKDDMKKKQKKDNRKVEDNRTRVKQKREAPQEARGEVKKAWKKGVSVGDRMGRMVADRKKELACLEEAHRLKNDKYEEYAAQIQVFKGDIEDNQTKIEALQLCRAQTLVEVDKKAKAMAEKKREVVQALRIRSDYVLEKTGGRKSCSCSPEAGEEEAESQMGEVDLVSEYTDVTIGEEEEEEEMRAPTPAQRLPAPVIMLVDPNADRKKKWH